MSRIVDEALVFHSSSGGDCNGRLFSWKGGLYRGIGAESAPLYERLFHEGVVQALCDKRLLIESEVTDLGFDPYPLVVRHRKIPCVSYPAEWSVGMLKQSALLILDLELELARHGLSIHDAHPWNVVFDGPRPFFVDLGAIMPLGDTSVYEFPREHPQWPAYGQFCSTLLYPLLVLSWGHSSIARGALLDYVGLNEYAVGKLAPWRALATNPYRRWALGHVRARGANWVARTGRRLPPLRWAVDAARNRKRNPAGVVRPSAPALPSLGERRSFLRQVRERVAAIEPTNQFAAALRELEQASENDGQRAAGGVRRPSGIGLANLDPGPEEEALAAVLARLRPASVLDLRSGRGRHALRAIEAGARVVACDVDEASVERLFRRARQQDLDLLPLRLDPRSSTPGVGPCNEWLLPATERLRADMVLAFAVVHQLVFKQYLTFEQIARTLDRFAHRWAVVEFLLPEDEEVQDLLQPQFAWYTREGFEESLRPYFRRVEHLESGRVGRCVLLCEKERVP